MRVSSKKEEYLQQVFGVESAEMRRVRTAIETAGKGGIQIGVAEGRFLQFLIRALGLRKIVEIGTLYGYSALVMAEALPDGGHLWTVEADAWHAQQARAAFAESAVKDRITVVEGDAKLELSRIAEQGPFDLIFIDANKSGYLDYLDWAEANAREGGFIVGDNTFLFGAVFDSEIAASANKRQLTAMLEFNRRLADRSRYNSVLLPTDEGLTVAQRISTELRPL